MSRNVAFPVASAAVLIAAFAAAATLAPAMKSIPPPAVETLRRSLRGATALVPAPEKPYAQDSEETKIDVEPKAPWDAKAKHWVRPARASAEYYYDVPDDAPGVTSEERALLGPIEVTVGLNGESRFADLASEGGPPILLQVPGATAVEVSAITPGSVQGRVAAMTPRQSEYRLAALTIFIADPAVEAAVRSAVKSHADPPSVTAPTSDPAEVQVIAIRIHGPKKPAEEFARRVPATSLRRLLHR